MKTKTILITLIAMVVITAIIFQSCKKENEPELPNNDEFSIPETTKVIDQNTWNSNFVALDSFNYIFTFKKDITNKMPINTGDIIVSTDGYGYLRKVTSIEEEGENIKVYTTFATLTEAVEKGNFSFNTILSEQKIKSINYLKEGVILDTSGIKSTEETAMEYNIDTYLDNNEKVNLKGSFVLLPSVNAELDVEMFSVKKLKVEFVVDEKVNIENTIELFNIQYDKEIQLAQINFNPIIVMVGTVPVIIVPQLEIFAGVSLEVNSTVTTSVEQTLNYTAGMLYENSGWTNYKELTKQLNYQPPTLNATADAKAYIKPKLNLLFYGSLAPYLAGELYGRINAELQANPWWALYGGVTIGAGVKMEIFEEELLDYYTDPPVIKYEKLIIDANTAGGNQAPALPADPEPSNNAANQSVNMNVSWTCSDPENDPLTYDVYFGSTTSPGLATSNITNPTFNPGGLDENTTYYWKIVAKDDHNNTTEGPVWQFTTGDSNQPPATPSNPTPEDGDSTCQSTLHWKCSDPEQDPLTYDIYLAKINPPTIAATELSDTLFEPDNLEENTQYYWKVVAKDDHNNQTEGPVWTFTTKAGVGNTFTDPRDGQTYKIVTIGSQTWFAENLNYQIANSWCYNYNPANGDIYGRLYTWDAAMTACPSGWHLPSDDEWKTLEMHLGMSQSEADGEGFRGTDEGGKLKETGTTHWISPNTGATNSSCFTALAGGVRNFSGYQFYGLTSGGGWWSSTEFNSDNAYGRNLGFLYADVERDAVFKSFGYSVRCLKN